MANVVGQNVIVLDTAAATVVTHRRLAVTAIRWVGATTIGDAAVLTDKNGNAIWEDTLLDEGTVNNAFFPLSPPTMFNPPLPVNGLIIPTLGHGKLYVYCAD